MLDVGEVGGIAASVVRMTVGAARASVRRALTFGHADAVYVKLRNVFGHALALVSSTREAGNCKREHEKTSNSQNRHISPSEGRSNSTSA